MNQAQEIMEGLDRASIARSFAKAGQEIDAEDARVSKALDKLPDGHQIKNASGRRSWTLATVAGSRFWIDDKKGTGLTHAQLFREVGAKIVRKHVKLPEAMRKRPPALEPWKNRKHVRIRQKANDMVASGELKPKACQHRGCSVGPTKTVKHHVDYDRPDNVKWYCEPHHDDTHVAIDKMPVESCSGNCPTCDRESCRCSYNVTANQSQKIIQSLQEGTP